MENLPCKFTLKALVEVECSGKAECDAGNGATFLWEKQPPPPDQQLPRNDLPASAHTSCQGRQDMGFMRSISTANFKQ